MPKQLDDSEVIHSLTIYNSINPVQYHMELLVLFSIANGQEMA